MNPFPLQASLHWLEHPASWRPAIHEMHAARVSTFVQSQVPELQQRLRTVMADANLITSAVGLAHGPNPVAANLRMLAQLLHFSPVEQVWLRLAYVWSRSGLALPDVQLAGDDVTVSVLAALLDQPMDAVRHAMQPNRLRALQLLSPRRYTRSPLWLSDELQLEPAGLALLETPHRTHAHLLNTVMDNHFDELDYQCDGEWMALCMPPAVVDSYRQKRRGEPLKAAHIAAVIEWCSDWPIASEVFTDLSGHLHMAQVRQTVKQVVFEACRMQQPLTRFDLLKALYAIAT